MAEDWAIAGVDLHLALGSRRPGRDVEAALRDAVRGGRLPPGTRLPSTRTLAADLGIARNTVAAVYDQLTAEGWLSARVGAGTWVALPRTTPSPQAPERTPRRAALDLRPGFPDAAAFPRSAWAAATRRALTDAPSALLGYGDPLGVEPLRRSLAAYLARARGVRSAPGSVVVTCGFGDLLALVGRALVARGARRVAVERYGHAGHRDVLRAAGLELVAVDVDDGGLDVARLADLPAVDAVLVTSAHQFPTGVPLAPARRRALVSWAQRTGGLVVEDDYDGEFRYDRRAVGALQALAPDHVVFAGTASKALSPALGLAWAAVPPSLLDDVARERRLSGVRPDALAQLTLARFLDDHDYDRTVRRRRAGYRARRAELQRVVEERLPSCRVGGVGAGLHCLLELPAGTDEDAVVAAAATRDLALQGLSSFDAVPGGAEPAPRHPLPRRPALVVGYGAPPDHRFRPALGALVASVRQVLAGCARVRVSRTRRARGS